MVSVTRAAHDIEITAESLQEDLARLQIQKQALERELAAVVAHLGSVQRALGALQAVMVNPAGAKASTGTGGAAIARSASIPAVPQKGATSPESGEAAGTSAPKVQGTESGKGEDHTVPVGADTDAQKKYGMLTEQIMEYFATVGDSDVRARDVAAALRRDTDSGSINAVRSTLDRLVGTSRIQRTGRGLYRAKRS
ncbi:hypothetical protein AB0N87_09680 [Streptomyces sp. NPDC093228]|uniref:hypothetical protein n=1 Tax=unclassified Streptomyces TaxID=2593676 RepID=UPI000740E20E|nr:MULTISPECIES: hypothetical protein [unclassified Streptomyces]KUJ41175.1 hypothetical protein ADL25_17295 [Streptomyces sp. NRRL F-5122]MDX3261020.1 hypothetical protein [Streptomyces sp. MI02-2A]REE64686.1 hypothetical protein BX257_7383 [Streptomyces sp. 3212.3]